jgi:hypothetical protein
MSDNSIEQTRVARPTRTRTHVVRFTDAEHADAVACAAALGISLSRLCRSRAEALPPSRADLELASELRQIGINVNQIAHQINAGNAPGLEVILPVLEALHGGLSELRGQLRSRT